MEKFFNFIMPILKNITIRVRKGTLMAFIFCIVSFYLISKILGFQNWTTFDQVFFCAFYFGFYGLMVHCFNDFIDKITEKMNKNHERKEEKENLLYILDHCPEHVKNFFEKFVKQNSDTIIMQESQHDILNYLRLRDINIHFLSDKYYRITKEQLEILKDYFRV